MPNTDDPSGLTAVKNINGATDPGTNPYSIASGYATALGLGAPVMLSGTADAKGTPGIVIGTNAGPLVGVFAGCEYTNSLGERIYSKSWPAGTVATDIVATVFDDPQTLFEIQGDEDIVAADIGLNADLVIGAINATTEVSTAELDSSSIAATDTLPLKIVRGGSLIDFEAGDYARVLVQINNHSYGHGNGATGL